MGLRCVSSGGVAAGAARLESYSDARRRSLVTNDSRSGGALRRRLGASLAIFALSATTASIFPLEWQVWECRNFGAGLKFFTFGVSLTREWLFREADCQVGGSITQVRSQIPLHAPFTRIINLPVLAPV